MLSTEQESKLRDLFDRGLTCGIGSEKQTCIEGALCLVLYGDLSDNHRGAEDCRGESIVRASITLNDANWSSPEARAKGLWPLALAQIESASLDQVKIAKRYAELTIRKVLPIVLRKAGLEAEALRCERDGDEASARDAARAARAAYAYADAAYAADAARAAYAYADAAYAADAARAAYAADADAAAAAAADADADEILTLSASFLVQAIEEAREEARK
jgi:hypothetical protein